MTTSKQAPPMPMWRHL